MSDLTMDAILANIFLAVQNRLTPLATNGFIDQDLAQLEIDEPNSPVKFPCWLLDFVDIRYTDDSENIQQAECILEVRLALRAYSAATHYYKNDTHKINALADYNLEHNTNKLLHGWTDGINFTPLSRIGSATEKRKDNVRVRVLRYGFGFTDYTAMNVTTSAPLAGFEVDVTINTKAAN